MTHDTPLGPLHITFVDGALRRLDFTPDPNSVREPSAAVDTLRRQLDAYFAGQLTSFSVALAPTGTPFLQQVWRALCQIPFGDTTSYGALASVLGRPGAARAVGAANGKNPIAIVVPCHRVIGTDGQLTGYAGGLPRKAWLLEHEARVRAAAAQKSCSQAVAITGSASVKKAS